MNLDQTYTNHQDTINVWITEKDIAITKEYIQ